MSESKKVAPKYLRDRFADHGRVHRRLLRPVDTGMTLAWRYEAMSAEA
jgi:hypothetical protein